MILATLQASFPRHAQNLSFRSLLALVLCVLSAGALYWLPVDLSVGARLALATFAICIMAWTLTPLNDTFVALLAAIGLVLSEVISAQGFFASIGNSVVWLMIGAFIVARGLNQSGLSARVTGAVARRAQTVGQLFYLLTAVLLLTAIVIPSTSGRAALLVPIYQALTTSLHNRRINRALAVALPVNILLTAVASLVGAGAHFVINDTLRQMSLNAFSFVEWLLMGLPFAAVSAFGSTWIILRLFLRSQERTLRLDHLLPAQLVPAGPWSRQERFAALVAAALILLWATESWHGIDNALVAVLGALALTLPGLGALKFKDAAKSVEWEMILFVAASLALSEALIVTGAGAWLIDTAMAYSGMNAAAPQVLILVGVAAVTLTSHLYITSRSARGAVIAPLVVLLALSLEIAPHVLAFVTAAGIGYCITLAVSAKPLTMFQRMGDDQPAFSAGDLARLSVILGPLHLALMIAFALFYWQPLANALHPSSPVPTISAIATAPAPQAEGMQRGDAEQDLPPVAQPSLVAQQLLPDATAQNDNHARQPGRSATRPAFHANRGSIPIAALHLRSVGTEAAGSGADDFDKAPVLWRRGMQATLGLSVAALRDGARALPPTPTGDGTPDTAQEGAPVIEPVVQPPAAPATQPAGAAPVAVSGDPIPPPPAPTTAQGTGQPGAGNPAHSGSAPPAHDAEEEIDGEVPADRDQRPVDGTGDNNDNAGGDDDGGDDDGGDDDSGDED